MKQRLRAINAGFRGCLQPSNPTFLLAAVLIPIMAARAYMVLRYGSSSPFWDQWDAEIDNLLLRYARGELSLGDFFAAHNEHRIVFTRLISLGLFIANGGQFDAKVEMLFNLLPYAAAIGAMTWIGLRTLPVAAGPLLAVGVTMLAVAPFGWENLIAGFQNQFYILTLLSIVTVWLVSGPSISLRRGAAIATCALLALFTMASGVFAAAAAAGLLIYRLLARDIDRRQGWSTLVALLAIVAVGLALMPDAPHGDKFNARSVAEFGQSLRMVLSWPLRPSLTSLILLWLPTVVLCVVLCMRLWKRTPAERGERFALAMAGWVLVQAVAMSFSRGEEVHNGVTSRYTDLLAIGVINNLWLVLHAAHRTASAWRPAVRALVPTLFLGWIVLSGYPAAVTAESAMQNRSNVGGSQVRLLAGYLADGRLEALQASPDLLPYPGAERIARTLSQPDAAALMPPEIRRPVPVDWSACPRLSRSGAFTALPDKPHAVGSYDSTRKDANRVTCTTAPFHVDAGTFTYFIAGATGAPGMQAILSNGQRRIDLAARVPGGDQWFARTLRLEDGMFQLQFSDGNEATWLALSPPVRVGALSAARLWLEARPGRVACLAVVLWILLLSLAAPARRPPNPVSQS